MCLPREIFVDKADRLCVRPPREIDDWLTHERTVSIQPTFGNLMSARANARGSSASGRIALGDERSALMRLTVVADFEDLRGGLGLYLFTDTELASGLRLFWDAATGRVSLSDVIAGEESDRMPEPLVANQLPARSDGTLMIDVYLRGNILEVFVDRQVALTHRCYTVDQRWAHVLVEDGIANFEVSFATDA